MNFYECCDFMKKVYLMYILFEIKVRENFLKWTDKKEIWLEINAAFDKLE